jgi:trehalose-6-phosphatase
MLTTTQKQWADAQRGSQRVAILTGHVADVVFRSVDQYDLSIVAEDGSATQRITASHEVAEKHRGEEAAVRIEGKVTDVRYDEAEGRVGLVIQAPNGSVVEWHTPQMSDEEEAAQQVARQAEQDQIDAEDREREHTALRQQIIDLINGDADVRAAIRVAVNDV